MRWWSDCTASWREKWAGLRDERNQLREELRIAQRELETARRKIGGMEEADSSATDCHRQQARVGGGGGSAGVREASRDRTSSLSEAERPQRLSLHNQNSQSHDKDGDKS